MTAIQDQGCVYCIVMTRGRHLRAVNLDCSLLGDARPPCQYHFPPLFQVRSAQTMSAVRTTEILSIHEHLLLAHHQPPTTRAVDRQMTKNCLLHVL